jgi:death on curing protein
MTPVFLSLDDALAIHAHQIEHYGGSAGLRDVGLLQSALAMPAATFGDVYLHGSLHEMAAAYVFHLTQNHPFVDGNKRVGVAAGLIFLRLNGLEETCSEDDVIALGLRVADGKMSKAEIAVLLAKHSRKPPRRR